MHYVRTEEVIFFHERLIEKYGGLKGIRDLGLLSSAMAMPKQSFMGEDLHQSIYEKGAAYLYHIVKNHPFFDGNKRTGIFVCLIFFERNEVRLNLEDSALEEITVAVADNRINKTELAILFSRHAQPGT